MTRVTLNRIVNFAASPAVVFYALPWLMILITIGTIAQTDIGLHASVETFFSSWIVWFNFLPLPGGMLTLSVLTLNLLARFLFKSEWIWSKAGIHLTHLGVLVLLFGGLAGSIMAREYYMIIPEGKSADTLYAYQNGEIRVTPPTEAGGQMSWGTKAETLPFTLDLMDFTRINYPGTDTPESYHSDIKVSDNGATFPVRIGMNAPLRYNGYTFFQSSFIDVGNKQATVLQVARNDAAMFPYLSGGLIAAGLIVHLILKRKRLS